MSLNLGKNRLRQYSWFVELSIFESYRFTLLVHPANVDYVICGSLVFSVF